MTSPTADGQGWRPMATAPRDGTEVLLVNRKGNIATGLWQGEHIYQGWWLRGGNRPDTFFNGHHGPIGWLPLDVLPPPPTSGEGA